MEITIRIGVFERHQAIGGNIVADIFLAIGIVGIGGYRCEVSRSNIARVAIEYKAVGVGCLDNQRDHQIGGTLTFIDRLA